MGRPNPPRDYCKKLLPVAIDEIASKEPHRTWASLPVDDWDLAQGFEDVSFAALANAINKVAHAIEAAFGRSSTFETFAYLGVPDVRYHLVQMAAIKTGYKVLLSSPLNSTNVHTSLMEKTQCVALLSANGALVTDILRAHPVKHALIPELDDLLSLQDQAPPYPFHKTWDEGKLDPYMVLHSSGTTGDPKPVEYTHLFYGNAWTYIFLPDVYGREHFHDLMYPGNGTRFLLTSAPFHAMSATCALPMSVFGQGILCPGFRHRAITTGDIREYLEYARVTKAALTPWMMEDVARKPNPERYIKPFESVLFGGGIQFRRSEAEFFDERGSQVPLYEIVLTMTDETAPYASWHVRQGMTPDNTKPPYPEYRPGDLWTPHPDLEKAPFVFKFAGRTDDTFTLSTASNIHPGPIETAIGAHPKAGGVMIVGNQRRQPLALIEVAEGAEPTAGLKEEIWESVIEAANANMPAHATITRTHVALVPHASFIRTPIGKVIRRKTEAKYADLINKVYNDFGDQWQGRQGRFSSITATTQITVEVSDSNVAETTTK
ncbi:hypothetical protein Daus18300_012733 [Diaporthe australafricana]|uniref:AMP-dependent synthetase/ligase domain-containing protein n=1 Tax=Diaporthe australafricana TaxID=127596 RepID=A0ABR3W1N5_9PEZI